MVRKAALIASAISIASPSGAAVSMYFPGDGRAVAAQLADICIAKDASILEQDEYHVLCSKPVKGFKGVLAQALIGNSYSTPPELHVRFAIVSTPEGVRVQASQWLETQMAFGQMRRQPLDDPKADASLRDTLTQYGGSIMPVAERSPTPRLLRGDANAPKLPDRPLPSCDQSPKPDPCE